MNKFLKINLVALPFSALLTMRAFKTGAWGLKCGSILGIIGVQIGILFAVALIGFFGLLAKNMSLSEQDRFMDIQSLKMKPVTGLNSQTLSMQSWFSFFMIALAISLGSLVTFSLLSAYLNDSGICSIN
jgi:hypothetical protein